MKISKQTTTRRKSFKITRCDLCGVDSSGFFEVPKFADIGYSTWSSKMQSIFSRWFYRSFSAVSCYYSGNTERGLKLSYSYDVCPVCFITKLVPFLESKKLTIIKK